MPRRMHLRRARSDLILDLVDTRREPSEEDDSDQGDPLPSTERERSPSDPESAPTDSSS